MALHFPLFSKARATREGFHSGKLLFSRMDITCSQHRWTWVKDNHIAPATYGKCPGQRRTSDTTSENGNHFIISLFFLLSGRILMASREGLASNASKTRRWDAVI